MAFYFMQQEFIDQNYLKHNLKSGIRFSDKLCDNKKR